MRAFWVIEIKIELSGPIEEMQAWKAVRLYDRLHAYIAVVAIRGKESGCQPLSVSKDMRRLLGTNLELVPVESFKLWKDKSDRGWTMGVF